MIFEQPVNDAEASVNGFGKSKMISGNPKNTFGKIKNIIYLSKLQFAGKNLQGLKVITKIAGNNLQ